MRAFIRAGIYTSIVITLGCGGPGGSGAGGESSQSSTGSTSGGTSGAGEMCSVPDDCRNIACECESGPPVNTRHCTNHQCESPQVACPKSCQAFGTTWTGNAWYPGSSDTGSSSSTGSTGGGASCSSFYRNNSCGQCGQSQCCAEGAACNASSCIDINSCVASCEANGGGESACISTCKSSFPDGASDYDAWLGCMLSRCADAC